MKSDKLTDKQQRFVEEYTVDFNATRAAKAAGYSERSAEFLGHDALRNPKVSKAIQAEKQKLSIQTQITKESLINDLAEIKRRCMQSTMVTEYDKSTQTYEPKVDESGNLVYEFDPANAVKAITQISKMLGFDEPIRFQDETVFKSFDKLPPGEREEAMREYVKELVGKLQ